MNINKDHIDIFLMLEEMILNTLKHDHPLRQLVVKAGELYGHRDAKDANRTIAQMIESRRLMRRVVEEFRILPEPQRRIVLNGWNLCPNWITGISPDDLQEAREGNIHPAILMCDDHAQAHYLRGEFRVDNLAAFVAPGAKKRDVINALRTLAKDLEKNWDKMIANVTEPQWRRNPEPHCYECAAEDVELVEVDGNPLCPACVAERFSEPTESDITPEQRIVRDIYRIRGRIEAIYDRKGHTCDFGHDYEEGMDLLEGAALHIGTVADNLEKDQFTAEGADAENA